MAELVLRGIETHESGERWALRACRTAGRTLAGAARVMLHATAWFLRLGSPSMQMWISERNTGLPGNPWPGAWAGPRADGRRSPPIR